MNTMDDMIRRGDAFRLFCRWCAVCPEEKRNPQGCEIMPEFLIEGPPVDAVEVVRCRDCVYYNTAGCADGFGWCEDSVVNTGTTDDFYCARGKRKEDGDE